MYFDFHVHTYYSGDSILSPETILKVSKRQGLSGLAVTDHNTIKGAIKTKEISSDDFVVIVGSEILTDKCEVIGIFLNEEIKKGDFFDIIDEIKDQDGITILPHPYKGNSVNPASIIQYVDFVEALNARIHPDLNEKAHYLAESFGKKMVAGSDSHTHFEIGNIRNKISMDCLDEEYIRKKLKYANIQIEGKESPYYVRNLSKFIGRYKKSGILGLSQSIMKKIQKD